MRSKSGSIAAQMMNASSGQDAGRIRAAYMRVSTEDQNLDLQERLIEAQKPDRTYSDLESGTIVERRAYTELCKEILLGRISEVIVYRLDRLGRDPIELIKFFNDLERKHVRFISLTEPWLTEWNMGPMQYLMWWNQLGMTKFELLLLKDRQRRGIDAARKRGVHMGRPRKNRPAR
jgi:DNA invertase Pin-like site-specific DNA recombinase